MTFRLSSRRRVAIDFGTTRVTEQHHAPALDASTIVKQFSRGAIATLNRNATQGMYADLPEPLDLQDAYEIQRQAEEAFKSLPSAARAHFKNDPVAFMAAVHDPAADELLRDLGIKNPKPVPSQPPASGPGSAPVPGSGPIGPDGK